MLVLGIHDYRVEVAADPEGENGREAHHFYEQWHQDSEPELELLVGAWHCHDAAHVSEDEHFKSQSYLIMSLQAKFGSFFLIKCLKKVRKASW